MKPTSQKSAPEAVDVLAFGAHPDDIEFGCGGVIARETQAGAKAHFVVCSRGEAGTQGTPEERTAEAERAASLLGASLEFLTWDGDAHLAHKTDHVLALAAIIRAVKPRSLLAPTTVENQHPDHAVVGRIVRDAARLARYGGVKELRDRAPHSVDTLLYYAVTPEGEPADRSAVLMDVSDPPVLAAWTSAMEAHASQLRTRNYVELQLTRARLNGLRAGLGHAIAVYPNDPLVFRSLGHIGRSARRF